MQYHCQNLIGLCPCRRIQVLMVLVLLASALSACSNSDAVHISSTYNALQTEYALIETTATAEKSSLIRTTTAIAHLLTLIAPGTSTPTPKPSARPTLSMELPEPIPSSISLEISQVTFIVDYERIFVTALVTNHSSAAVLMSQYQVSLYDVNGKLIQASTGMLDYIPANETVALADILLTPRKTQYAPEYNGVDQLIVQISRGVLAKLTSEEESAVGRLSILEAIYFDSDYFPKVTGVVASESDFDLVDIPVVAILYDENDAVVGGGYSYISFIAAHGESPVEIGVIKTGKPDHVQLMPRISISSFE